MFATSMSVANADRKEARSSRREAPLSSILWIAVVCMLPQTASQPAAVPQNPSVQTDPNGWPVMLPSDDLTPARRLIQAAGNPAHAELHLPEPTPSWSTIPAAPGGAALAPGSSTTGLSSPLRDVWAFLGQPSDFAALGDAHAQIVLHLYDSTGTEIATRPFTHEATLGEPERDRLTFAEGRKVFGRDGPAVWAMIDNLVWHSREQEARQMLDVMGLLLRLPWVFSDSRYSVHPPEPTEVDGVRKLKVRVQAPGDPTSPTPTWHRYELICSPDRMLPEELWYRRAGSDSVRRVALLEYQQLPAGILVPVRRVFLAEDGTKLLEMEVVRMECRLSLPDDRFRPPVRGESLAGQR